jgi:hypothetical protein
MQQTHIVTITKRYIIDYLNALCFSNIMVWDDHCQYNALPLFHIDLDEGSRCEQRGALLVHKHNPWALRMLVTAQDDNRKSICYRITSIEETIQIDDPKRIVRPFDSLKLDFSISDLSLGTREDSSYSFYDRYGNSVGRTVNLLRFLLDSMFVSYNDPKLFSDLLIDMMSAPPISGDLHYNPLYGLD